MNRNWEKHKAVMVELFCVGMPMLTVVGVCFHVAGMCARFMVGLA